MAWTCSRTARRHASGPAFRSGVPLGFADVDPPPAQRTHPHRPAELTRRGVELPLHAAQFLARAHQQVRRRVVGRVGGDAGLRLDRRIQPHAERLRRLVPALPGLVRRSPRGEATAAEAAPPTTTHRSPGRRSIRRPRPPLPRREAARSAPPRPTTAPATRSRCAWTTASRSRSSSTRALPWSPRTRTTRTKRMTRTKPTTPRGRATTSRAAASSRTTEA